jgi:hypothetical protein
MENYVKETNKPIVSEEWLKGLPLQSEKIGFQSEEMLFCTNCKRKSPPTRLKCMYCGTEMQIASEQEYQIKTHLRKMESWEKGFNVVYLAKNLDWKDKNNENLAELLNKDKKEIEILFETKKALPLARLDSLKSTEILLNRLKSLGLICMIVSDEEMKLETASSRLRGINFFDDGISLKYFNTDNRDLILWDDIRLIVFGRIFERKLETAERRKRKEEHQIVNTTEISYDETVIDIYDKYSALGYRISAKGFDFSCLGDKKTLFANENMKSLIAVLQENAEYSRIDDEYANLRIHLKSVWEVEHKTDSNGWQREKFGSINRANLVTISNLEQFTRYSRLQWHLINK